MKAVISILIISFSFICSIIVAQDNVKGNLPDINGYPIVGTNQTVSFDNLNRITKPNIGDVFYGQNSNYSGTTPKYVNNGDGTVTDMVTGLMWQQTFDQNNDGKIDYNDKLTYKEIIKKFGDGDIEFSEYNDWRLPTIKELYSLIQFSGKDISPQSTSTKGLTPFIDNKTFEFAYGDLSAGERLIDMQVISTTVYVSKEVQPTAFGVNFADGRIKGYEYTSPGRKDKAFHYLLVRGNKNYGKNNFIDNGDGTITNKATCLMWMQDDNGAGISWEEALAYAEGKEFAGYTDWRLPDAKELQSIVDYTRSPASTGSAAIDPMFNCTQITNEAGDEDYPWYWSSTTHEHEGKSAGSTAVYIAFGKSLGNMPKRPFAGSGKMRPKGERPGGQNQGGSETREQHPQIQTKSESQNTNWIDVHGAGSQRSDPKSGNPDEFSQGRGPQGDAIRIYNYVRLVRNIDYQ